MQQLTNSLVNARVDVDWKLATQLVSHAKGLQCTKGIFPEGYGRPTVWQGGFRFKQRTGDVHLVLGVWPSGGTRLRHGYLGQCSCSCPARYTAPNNDDSIRVPI